MGALSEPDISVSDLYDSISEKMSLAEKSLFNLDMKEEEIEMLLDSSESDCDSESLSSSVTNDSPSLSPSRDTLQPKMKVNSMPLLNLSTLSPFHSPEESPVTTPTPKDDTQDNGDSEDQLFYPKLEVPTLPLVRWMLMDSIRNTAGWKMLHSSSPPSKMPFNIPFRMSLTD